MFSIAHIAIRPYCKLPPFQIHPHSKFTHVTICPYFQFPHVEGLIAIRPYTGVIRTFANIHVNIRKKHHGHGVSTFACVVGAKSASWRSGVCDAIRPHPNSPTLYFAHITNSPMWKGELQFAHTTICPYCKIHPCCKFVHIVNSSMLQIHLCCKFTYVFNCL